MTAAAPYGYDAMGAPLSVPRFSAPGCPTGPQGFHVYEPVDTERLTLCMDCGKEQMPVGVLAELVTFEPPLGSVVMEKGPSGTAWQRHANGSWKSTTGRSARWSALTERSSAGSRTWLVYVPPAR